VNEERAGNALNGEPHDSSLTEKLSGIKRRMADSLVRSEKPNRVVKLIAVSKTFPAETIIQALDSGLRSFGENRVQEIQSKFELLSDRNIEWHFIGHLQTNKVKKLLEVPVSCIHSLDRLELGVELDRQLQKLGKSRDVLVEVNTSREASKDGVSPDKLEELVRELSGMGSLNVKGLMTIGALSRDADVIRQCFVRLRECSSQIRNLGLAGIEMDELSMGMSGDFEIAIEEGATMIRIGSALFGERTSTRSRPS